jgi:uncharacterized protein (DUF486 family)
MRTIFLLLVSNCFMTFAWYGHLKKDLTNASILKLIFISWGIAFFEYCFMVPANNKYGLMEGFSPFQLKTIQEVISLFVFFLFAIFILKESFRWNYLVAFLFIAAGVFFMFYKQSPK